MAPHEIRNILVIKLSALGDFILALAAMKRIREAHPGAKITLLTTPPFETLAKASPYVDAVETDGRPGGLGEWLRLLARLRSANYDRVYDLQTSSRSSLIFYGLLPFPPEWSGIALGASHRHRNPKRDFLHTLERQADQLMHAGVWRNAPTGPGAAPPPDLSWIVDSEPKPRAGDKPAKPYVLLIPGGAAHRLDKRWPVELYGDLGKALWDRGYDVMVIGGPQETPLARAIQRKLPGARDLTGRTDFARIAALGAKAALVVGNDTGPLHLAAAAGAPTSVLFSKASDPALAAPRGHVTVLQAEDLAGLPVETVLRAVDNITPPASATVP
jgi:ADP-heptose:LPS heptosyltransferase